MSKEVVVKAAERLKHEVKMSHNYFLRKLSYLTQQHHSKYQLSLIKSEKANLLLNFKYWFPYYSQNKHLMDSFMQFAYRDRISDPKLWSMFGTYLLANWDNYRAGELTHIGNMLVKYEVPTGFMQRLERKSLAELGNMTTQEIAMACKQTQGEGLLRKVREDTRIKVDNEMDLYFFTAAYLAKKSKFRDTVDQMKSKLVEMLPTWTDATRLCQILREYSEYQEPLPATTISAIETAILSEKMVFSENCINEVLLTLYSKQYASLISQEFWQQFEEKVIKGIASYRASRILATFARRCFPSSQLLTTAVPIWMKDVDKLKRKEVFRQGFCALMKYSDVTEETKQWCLSQSVYFRQHLDSFDIATMLRAVVLPGWYNPVLWQVLVDRFFSPVISPPTDLDKSMVYFALKSLEIDEVKLPNLPKIPKEEMDKMKEIYETTRFHTDKNAVHEETASALASLSLSYREFAPVTGLYAPDFVLDSPQVVILCFEWTHYLCPVPRVMTLGTKMMLRHLNKVGWSVVLVANDKDLAGHLAAVLTHIRSSKTVLNLQVV